VPEEEGPLETFLHWEINDLAQEHVEALAALQKAEFE
jgi:hypothetical protein